MYLWIETARGVMAQEEKAHVGEEELEFEQNFECKKVQESFDCLCELFKDKMKLFGAIGDAVQKIEKGATQVNGGILTVTLKYNGSYFYILEMNDDNANVKINDNDNEKYSQPVTFSGKLTIYKDAIDAGHKILAEKGCRFSLGMVDEEPITYIVIDLPKKQKGTKNEKQFIHYLFDIIAEAMSLSVKDLKRQMQYGKNY